MEIVSEPVALDTPEPAPAPEPAPEPEPAPDPEDLVLLREIRDLLKKG